MFKKISGIIAISVLLSSCASIKVEPQANRVITSPNPAPAGCKFLGEVIGNQGNFFTGSWTSNKNLEQGARNDLKNQAGKMGANYVQIVASRSGNTGSMSNSMGGMEQTNVTYTGNAYWCRPSSIGL